MPHRSLQLHDLLRGDGGFQLLDRVCLAVADQNPALFIAIGIPHRNADQESVQLAFRQRIRPLELERVLCGNDHEQGRQVVRVPVGRHLTVTHGLEQGALGAWRSAVDLVGQNNVGKDGPAIENKVVRLGVVDTAADDVAGQQVGRELNAAEHARHALCQGFRHERFANARNVLQQHVLACQQCYQTQTYDFFFAVNRLTNICFELID